MSSRRARSTRATAARRRPADGDDHRRAGRDPRQLDGLAAVAGDPGRGGRAGAHPVGLGALRRARLGPADPARGRQRTGGTDHLGEPWAVPLAEARLSTFLAADKDNTEDAPDAFLSGAITDAKARYNLANVVKGGKIDRDRARRAAAPVRDRRPLGRRRHPHRDRPARRLAAAAARPGRERRQRGAPPRRHPPIRRSCRARRRQLGLAGHRAGRGAGARALRRDPARRRPSSTSTPPRARCSSRRSRASTWRPPSASSSRASGCRSSRVADLQALAPSLPAASFDRIATGSDFFEVRGRLRLGDVVLEQRSLVQRRGRRRSRCCSASASPRATAWAREPVQKCAAILRRRYNRAT